MQPSPSVSTPFGVVFLFLADTFLAPGSVPGCRDSSRHPISIHLFGLDDSGMPAPVTAIVGPGADVGIRTFLTVSGNFQTHILPLLIILRQAGSLQPLPQGRRVFGIVFFSVPQVNHCPEDLALPVDSRTGTD